MSQLPKRVYAITLRKAHSLMKAQGFEAANLLANTHLTESDLSEPYSMISEDQARTYYLNLVHLADRDGVGLEIGWRTAPSDMGPHGLALLTEKTGGEALRKTWELRDNYNVLADWSFTTSENLVIFTAHSNEQNGKLRSFLIERTLATIQALTEELLGGDAKPLRVQLDYKKPANVELYEEVFRCPLRFAQEQSQIYYPQDWADLPLETYDPEAVDVLGALRTRLHKKLSSSDDIVQDVKMLLQRTPGVFPSLERVAESLAMSSRTLHRKLGQHNLHYQDLLDEERRQVAEELLLTTPMSIQQIAEQCGFADAQNFSQAFRRWQGLSPSEFRISYK